MLMYRTYTALSALPTRQLTALATDFEQILWRHPGLQTASQVRMQKMLADFRC
jgi:hypothetical protein